MRDCIAKGILTDAIENTNKLFGTWDIYRFFDTRYTYRLFESGEN